MGLETNFFPARGCFYRVEQGAGKEYYRLSPNISDSFNTPVLLQAAPINLSDIVAPVACMNNIKVFYTFGQNFGGLRLQGQVLLGPSGNMNAGESLIESYFQDNRTSVNGGKLLKLSRGTGGSSATPFFLTKFSVGNLNTELHILPFIFEGVVVESKK